MAVVPPKTRAAKAKQNTKAEKKPAAAAGEGGARAGRGGGAAGGRGRGARAAAPAARAALPRLTRAAGADRTGGAAGAAGAADAGEPVQLAGNMLMAAVQPPAAEMVGAEGGTEPKDGPADDKAKEDEASTAPLPEKVLTAASLH